MSEKLIPLLDRDTQIASISEWDQPVERGGVKTAVGEYSMSVVGPGPRATHNWKIARAHGLRTVAKVQFNNTWEISAVPYIPVPHLVLEHCERLEQAGITGLMASWTCGGYPSPNLAAARYFYYSPRPSRDEILRLVARERYGVSGEAAAAVVEAWRLFSEAFMEFPYGVALYVIPTQHGPANLLRAEATGQAPSMILFPQDAMKAWCGRYPPEVVQSQFSKLAARWREGLTLFERTVRVAEDVDVARTCYHHFQSVANQVEFYLRRGDRTRMRELAQAEIDLAKRQYAAARRTSTIAYEASNHYYYRPLDLVEKVLNCRRLMMG